MNFPRASFFSPAKELFFPHRPSLSSAPFRASLLVLLALAFFIAIFWTINEYKTYRQHISNIEENYQELYRKRVQEELVNVLESIDNQRALAMLHVEDELRVKVQSAYTIASHIYQRHKDNMSIAELRSMVVEILRPIRWNNGRGYYFTGRLKENTIDLFADDPLLEGQDPEQVEEKTYGTIYQELRHILQEKGAGIYRYQDIHDDMTGQHFPGMSFVKYFKPFDWYIGAGTSQEIMKTRLQEEILSGLQSRHFSENGHILCFRADGTILSHPVSVLVGRSITSLVSYQGEEYGKKMLHTGLYSDSGGSLIYSTVDGFSGRKQQRLFSVKPYSDWDWILVADISMAAMEKAIHDEKEAYTARTFKNVAISLVFLAVAVLFLLSIALYHSIKIKRGINLFTDFFRKAAHTQLKIRSADSSFAEFEDLGELANAMVDDITQKEHLLRRDELRLDTLLQLGTMEEWTIIDKYYFVLNRIIQITDSERGYIALVNQARSHCSLCSQINVRNRTTGLNRGQEGAPHLLVDSGLAGSCVLQKKPFIFNAFEDVRKYPSYPYKEEVQRRIDIPVNDSNSVVLVAGVCNSTREYDNSDIRQMTMLLEGMWLHVQKTCSEKEMAKLERQVIAISENERSRIGRDLHDDLGSHLSGVEVLSKVLQQKMEKQSPELAQQLSSIRNLIRDAIEKTHRLSRGLYPVHIIEHGLEAAIEELVAEIKERYSLACRLSFDGRVEPLGSDIAPHIYYIVREAIFNAAKHGKPNMIQITIQRNGNFLSAAIVDDGQGMTEQKTRKGLGLHTMRYRAKAIGATLEIQPNEIGGTTVSLSGEISP
ncbi:MAG: cache domain-containing protein [Desulfocapsa sp.]|nr:cache domain-containing protein [Desulfocapsa sp.]